MSIDDYEIVDGKCVIRMPLYRSVTQTYLFECALCEHVLYGTTLIVCNDILE